MAYTFDEAINSFKKSCTYGKQKNKTFSSEQIQVANGIIELLREEYAPTIEMTKHDYEIFKQAKVDKDSADWLDAIEWNRVDYKYPDFMQAWLHPETIKVIDEENHSESI